MVVVRGRPGAVEGPVVVGADGSDSANRAIGTAFDAAARRGTTVVAVRAYTPAQPPSGPYAAPYVEDREARQAAEREALEADVKPWAEKYPGIAVETVVVDRSAADVLIGISSTAQLVVVGTRGHGGFAGALIGSVGLHLLHHAECPSAGRPYADHRVTTHHNGRAPSGARPLWWVVRSERPLMVRFVGGKGPLRAHSRRSNESSFPAVAVLAGRHATKGPAGSSIRWVSSKR